MPTARRRRTALAAMLGVTVVAAGAFLWLDGAGVGNAAVRLPEPFDFRRPSAPPPPAYAAKGPNTFVIAPGRSRVFGSAGPLRRYRVAVETGSPVPAADFAAFVDATLSDRRSWIAGRNVRLQRVASRGGGYAFTVYLATPGTAYRLCRAAGLDIRWRGRPYTSCRAGERVVINIARFLTGVPGYGAPLRTYRQYAINHEVGHALGHGHELCPGRGRPAPVMQQQTFGLRGCVAYSWPFRGSRRYAGRSGEVGPA